MLPGLLGNGEPEHETKTRVHDGSLSMRRKSEHEKENVINQGYA